MTLTEYECRPFVFVSENFHSDKKVFQHWEPYKLCIPSNREPFWQKNLSIIALLLHKEIFVKNNSFSTLNGLAWRIRDVESKFLF